MKRFLRNARIFSLAFLFLALVLVSALVFQQYRSQTSLWGAVGENRAALASQYAKAGKIQTRDGVTLAASEGGVRKYAEDPQLAMASLQLVGDYTHIISTGIEAAYQDVLLGSHRNPFRQLIKDLTGKGLEGDDLDLTLDSVLQKTAFQGLGGQRGAAVLLNYQNGEILALASSPSTSPENVLAFENIPDTALLHRGLYGRYSPGSTFKMVTASSVLALPTFDPTAVVNCQKFPLVANGAREIYGNGHGPVNLTQAFAASCNLYFGEMGRLAGHEHLLSQAELWGYNHLAWLDRLPVAPSRFALPEHEEALLTWAAIGQPVGEVQLTVTPLQLALQAAVVARGGTWIEPHLVKDSVGQARQKGEGLLPALETGTPVLSAQQAEWEQTLMRATVQTGLAQALQHPTAQIAAKTGTAEVEGQPAANGLITAYLADEQAPLAVAVVMESVGSGAGQPLQLARNLLLLGQERLALSGEVP